MLHSDLRAAHAETISSSPRVQLSAGWWFTIALMPVLMAAVTWGPQDYHYRWQVWLRFFSLPVLAVEIFVIAAAVLGVGVRPLSAMRAMPYAARLALGAVVVIAMATALFVAVDPATALLRTTVSLIHVVFGCCVAVLASRAAARFDVEIWRLTVTGLLLYLSLLVIYVAGIRDPATFDWWHFGLAVSNIRFTGFFMVIGASAAVALACLAADGRAYWSWVVAATLFVGVMCWAGSRNPILSYSAALAIAAALVPQIRTRRLLAAWVSSLVGGALISLVYVPPHPAYGLMRIFSSAGLDGGNAISSGRVALWTGSVKAFIVRPLFGYGESQFIHVVPESWSMMHHPHNVVFQFLVQWGAIGALCALVLLAWAWFRIAAMARQAPERSLPALFVLTALLVAALFDGIFYFLYPAMMVALTIGLGLGPTMRREVMQG